MLIALLDPAHLLHEIAHAWFQDTGQAAWASCPLTQNAVLRIVGHRDYPGFSGGPAAVAPLLREMLQLPGHEFWPDDISLVEARRADSSRLLTAARVTDTYLLALAVAHAGQLATLDTRLTPEAVLGGRAALHLISAFSH